MRAEIVGHLDYDPEIGGFTLAEGTDYGAPLTVLDRWLWEQATGSAWEHEPEDNTCFGSDYRITIERIERPREG